MKKLLLIAAAIVALAGCAADTRDHVFDSGTGTQLQKRSYQSRAFDTPDRQKVMRACISTLQDLGFLIDNADAKLGSLTATKTDQDKYKQPYVVRMTVSIRARGEKQTLVRVNAQYNDRPMTNPKDYQDFFTSLEKALFLTANAAD
ncbi:MAG: hypothetical protein LBM56_02660 [Burkholderiaceae bacterium]|jgi:hypothetical protein|nr:hypothetical protein [Burkholderiaceae bacterium]